MLVVLPHPVVVLVLLLSCATHASGCTRVLRDKLIKYHFKVVNLVLFCVAELLVGPRDVVRLHEPVEHLHELAVSVLLHLHTFK